jgi:predicted acylesterase/phospholipase RssA
MQADKKNESIFSPFEKIGLSLSGGGYRAALYHLGSLSYLNKITYNRKPLLEKVKIISTVSGGTITGVVYAKHLVKYKKNFEFEKFYKFLKSKIFTLDLVSDSLSNLKDNSKFKNPSKSKNVINAFAELYDEHFTQGETFQIFDELPDTDLEGLTVNSTEFKYGLNFRFVDTGPKSKRLFGNKMLRVNRTIAKEVKLADAIAASSCFPGGFEPIIWPTDFKHENSLKLNEAKNIEQVGLMDGGIYDNQGISALIAIKDLSMIIISDVCSPYINKYSEYDENTSKDNFKDISINSIFNKIVFSSKIFNWIIGILLILCLTAFCFVNIFWKGFIVGITILLSIALGFKVFLLEKKPELFGTTFKKK